MKTVREVILIWSRLMCEHLNLFYTPCSQIVDYSHSQQNVFQNKNKTYVCPLQLHSSTVCLTATTIQLTTADYRIARLCAE